jgi:hypothetical protein
MYFTHNVICFLPSDYITQFFIKNNASPSIKADYKKIFSTCEIDLGDCTRWNCSIVSVALESSFKKFARQKFWAKMDTLGANYS